MVRPAFNVMPHGSVGRAVELARLAESLGYERCWVYDEGLAASDVYVALTAVAVATESLTIGPGITNPYTRHVGATASAIASLDEVSGGRAFLGIGAGGSLTLDPLSIARERPLTAVRETIDACRRLFAGDTVSVEGSHVRLSEAALLNARAGTEIWLAGRGPRMLQLGGAACDGVLVDFIYKPHLGAAVERIHRAGRAAGNDPRIAYSTMLVTDDDTMAAIKPHLTYRLVDSPVEVQEAIGLTDADAGLIRAALSEGLEAAAEHVRDEWALPFVISGSPTECGRELHRLAVQHGIESFVVPLLDDEPAEKLLQSGARIMEMIK
ncbi:MAG: LLM class flavin-dependent oxidoreductase [Acidimicrobiia bacterium]|nr:LLM class flavin-dependent oxidoreductase [Acidimicrobiia bacterium]